MILMLSIDMSHNAGAASLHGSTSDVVPLTYEQHIELEKWFPGQKYPGPDEPCRWIARAVSVSTGQKITLDQVHVCVSEFRFSLE